MLKNLARVISILLFASAVFIFGGEVAAQTTQVALTVDSNQGPNADGQNSAKSANDYAFEKFSPALRNFIDQVHTGQHNLITGVYVDQSLALDVLQQPSDNPGYIASSQDSVTEFRMAREYGTIGLLAHNYLAGDLFFQLQEGQVIYLVYGDGTVHTYTIVNILSYQALQPTSPYSNFVNMENADDYLSAADLFYKVYGQEDALVLQTCIANQGIESWGRLFIVAMPGVFPVASGPL